MSIDDLRAAIEAALSAGDYTEADRLLAELKAAEESR
jgi:hypothetical protein